MTAVASAVLKVAERVSAPLPTALGSWLGGTFTSSSTTRPLALHLDGLALGVLAPELVHGDGFHQLERLLPLDRFGQHARGGVLDGLLDRLVGERRHRLDGDGGVRLDGPWRRRAGHGDPGEADVGVLAGVARAVVAVVPPGGAEVSVARGHLVVVAHVGPVDHRVDAEDRREGLAGDPEVRPERDRPQRVDPADDPVAVDGVVVGVQPPVVPGDAPALAVWGYPVGRPSLTPAA